MSELPVERTIESINDADQRLIDRAKMDKVLTADMHDTPMELCGLTWLGALPNSIIAIAEKRHTIQLDDGCYLSGGVVYFDSDMWEQRDGPGTKPYRRARV